MTSQSPIIVSDISDDEDFPQDMYAATPAYYAGADEAPSSPAMPARYLLDISSDSDLSSKKRKTTGQSCLVCFDGEEEGCGFACSACDVWTHFEPCYEAYLKTSKQVSCSSCQEIIPRSQWFGLNFPVELIVQMERIWQQSQLEEEIKAEPVLFQRAQGRMAAAPFRAKAQQAKEEEWRLKRQLAQQQELVRLQTQRADTIEAGLVATHSSTTRCFTPNCEGFLTTGLSCLVCKKKFCRDCQRLVHVGMACNEEARANIKAILKETKPCPKLSCQERIYRIEGCFQMWCVKCNTFFDWTSSKVLDNPVLKHNPHYLEWKKNQENVHTTEVDDDGMPSFDSVQTAHDEKLANWPKWSHVSGIRRLVEDATEHVDNVRTLLRTCEKKRQDAGVQYTVCKLNTKASSADVKIAKANCHAQVFKYADQEEKLRVLYHVYFSLKTSLILILNTYLEDADVDVLYTACVDLETDTNRRLEELYFFPPIGLGRLFAFF